jgi:hypothetical protein
MACSPKARETCGSIASSSSSSSSSSSRFDYLPLDVDKKMFRSSSSRSIRCRKIAPTVGRLFIHQAQPPRSISEVVSPASLQNPDGGSRMPEVTREMLEYLWTDEEDEDQSSFGEPDGTTSNDIVSDQRFHSMVDALCGPND